ncbi:MAG: glycoside hydrolase [Bacteroidetes bacterium]|nr:glycoside hydrolase [Bacteroidota bacterium]
MIRKYVIVILCFFLYFPLSLRSQEIHKTGNFSVIGYYAGNAEEASEYPIEYLTHIIYSFCHVKNGLLSVDNKNDSATIRSLLALKQRNASLKVILSVGGWGGCMPCSEVFSTKNGRVNFSKSVKHLLEYFQADGIDLDWEYPAISGYPGHLFQKDDKQNFTLLLEALRNQLGKKYEISFAAGGFSNFLDSSVEWDKITPLVDRVNLMSYDLVNGFSVVSGHHTPLYATPWQKESTDYAVRYLYRIGFPMNKLVIGAAFYARVFDIFKNENNGLYMPCKFNHGISYKDFDTTKLKKEGFLYYWDSIAEAPYMYSKEKKQLISYDNEHSIYLKTKYALNQHLNGIMFWQLGDDKSTNGLLSVIHKTLKEL